MAIIVPEKLNDESTVDLKITTIEETTCKFENPLTDLLWLKELVDKLDSTRTKIHQYTYKYGIGFLVAMPVGTDDCLGSFKNCEGKTICYTTGLMGFTCTEFEIDFESRKFIWGIND
jgi:hypothetical protein